MPTKPPTITVYSAIRSHGSRVNQSASNGSPPIILAAVQPITAAPTHMMAG